MVDGHPLAEFSWVCSKPNGTQSPRRRRSLQNWDSQNLPRIFPHHRLDRPRRVQNCLTSDEAVIAVSAWSSAMGRKWPIHMLSRPGNANLSRHSSRHACSERAVPCGGIFRGEDTQILRPVLVNS